MQSGTISLIILGYCSQCNEEIHVGYTHKGSLAYFHVKFNTSVIIYYICYLGGDTSRTIIGKRIITGLHTRQKPSGVLRAKDIQKCRYEVVVLLE